MLFFLEQSYPSGFHLPFSLLPALYVLTVTDAMCDTLFKMSTKKKEHELHTVQIIYLHPLKSGFKSRESQWLRG